MNVFIQDFIDEILSLNKEQLARCLIVVPTERLSTYILASIAQKFEVLASPLILTMDNFIDYTFDSITDTTTISTSITTTQTDDVLVLFYISALLHNNKYNYLKPHDLDQLFSLFTSICVNGYDSSVFKTLKQKIEDDFFQSDCSQKNLFLKIDEIEDIYNHLCTLSTKQSCLVKKQKIDEIALYLRVNNLYFFKSYFINPSFYSKEYEPLFDILKTKSSCYLLDSRYDLFSFDNSNHDSLLKDKGSIEGYKFRSLIQEVDYISLQIKRLIELGLAPSGIGLILMNEKLYTPILRQRFDRYQIPYNFTSAVSVKESSLISWILMFFNLKNPQFYLYDFLTHPLSVLILSFNNQELFIDPDSLEGFIAKDQDSFFKSYSYETIYSKISSIISEGLIQTSAQLSFEDIISNIYHPLYYILKDLTRVIQGCFSSKDLDSCYKNLVSLYEFIKDYVSYVYKDDSYNLKAFDGFKLFIDYLLKLLKIKNFSFDFSEISGLFSEFINKSLYWSPGQSLVGVQVLKLPESVSYPFSKLFILGCNESNDITSQEEVLPVFLLEKMNLSTLDDLKKRQSYLYSSLFYNSTSVTLSYTEEDPSGCDRSSFVQILDLKSLINWTDLKNYSASLNISTSSKEVKTYDSLSFNFDSSQIKKILSTLSPTLSQSLIDCPYKFFIRYHIKDFNSPIQEQLYRVEGSKFHKIFETFIKEYKNINPQARLEYLKNLCQKILGVENESYFNLISGGFSKFLDFISELEQWGIDFKKSYTEHKIRPYTLRLSDSFYVDIHGIIDRLDKLDLKTNNSEKTLPLYLLTDYKSSSLSIPTDTKVRQGQLAQLLMYAKSLDASCICGYWDIKKASWHTSLVSSWIKEAAVRPKESDVLVSIPSCLSISKYTPSLEESFKALVSTLESRISSVMNQGFFKIPDQSVCSNCSYKNICNPF